MIISRALSGRRPGLDLGKDSGRPLPSGKAATLDLDHPRNWLLHPRGSPHQSVKVSPFPIPGLIKRCRIEQGASDAAEKHFGCTLDRCISEFLWSVGVRMRNRNDGRKRTKGSNRGDQTVSVLNGHGVA